MNRYFVIDWDFLINLFFIILYNKKKNGKADILSKKKCYV